MKKKTETGKSKPNKRAKKVSLLVTEALQNRTGPPKEKTQVTVRLDKQLMNAVNLMAKDTNQRLTDMIERGLVLALSETEYLPKLTGRVRFVLANATREQERLIRGLAVAMTEHEVREEPPSDYEQMIFGLMSWFLESRNELAHANKALDVYARYGKSAEEIAAMRA